MIEFLGSWIEQIVIAVLICSIFELILPSGNINKYIKMIMGVYIVFSIISPFVDSNAIYNLNSDNFLKVSEQNDNEKKSTVNQESMDKRLKEIYIEELENNIKQKVEEKGYSLQTVKVDADLNSSSTNPGIHKIDLKIKNQKKVVNEIEKIEINIDSNINQEKSIEENFNNVDEESMEKASEEKNTKESSENVTEYKNIEKNSEEVKELKKYLADYYEINQDIINIEIIK